MENREFYQIVGIIIGIGIVTVPILRYLINKWFEKEKEIVLLKEQRRALEFQSIRDDINGLGNKLRTLQRSLEHYEKLTVKMDFSVQEALKLFNLHKEQVQLLHDDLEKRVKSIVHDEIFRLKNKTIIEEPDGQ